MTYISLNLRHIVSARAGGKCEYCLRPEQATFFPHECDHIIALKHGGETTEDNLCLACGHCNRHKGSDFASLDPLTGNPAMIFNPHKDVWSDHFRLNDAVIEGKTPVGRATVRMLRMNDDDQLALRTNLIRLGRYP
jgi:hypothetical protein